jgi:hypothetical protein
MHPSIYTSTSRLYKKIVISYIARTEKRFEFADGITNRQSMRFDSMQIKYVKVTVTQSYAMIPANASR